METEKATSVTYLPADVHKMKAKSSDSSKKEQRGWIDEDWNMWMDSGLLISPILAAVSSV